MSAIIYQFPEPKKYIFNIVYLADGSPQCLRSMAVSRDACKKIVAPIGIFIEAKRL